MRRSAGPYAIESLPTCLPGWEIGENGTYQLVVLVEKALDKQETVLGVLLGIEGAFNNTCYNTNCGARVRHGSDYTIVGGLGPPWKAAFLWRPSIDFPCELRYPGPAHMEVCCHRFYGAWW